MTPAHITALRQQLGSGQALADRIHDVDPLLSPNRHTISRWEREGGASPNLHATAALARVWLTAGYPCTANGRQATLTTNNPASSHGLPVVVIDGVPYGSAEVTALDLGDVPETIREAAARAGYPA